MTVTVRWEVESDSNVATKMSLFWGTEGAIYPVRTNELASLKSHLAPTAWELLYPPAGVLEKLFQSSGLLKTQPKAEKGTYLSPPWNEGDRHMITDFLEETPPWRPRVQTQTRDFLVPISCAFSLTAASWFPTGSFSRSEIHLCECITCLCHWNVSSLKASFHLWARPQIPLTTVTAWPPEDFILNISNL